MPFSCEPFLLDGLACLRLNDGDGAAAVISLHGAHVLSWQPVPGRERLYLSPRASFANGAAIRGGIPVIFPQFAGRGPMIKHGLARLLPWRYIGIESDGAAPAAVLELVDGEQTRRHWPERFRARLHVALSPRTLTARLSIRNEGDAPFGFTSALHTYLRVDDLRGVSLSGLEGSPFEDSTRGGLPTAAEGQSLRFEAETDRIYPDVTGELCLREGDDAIHIGAEGFRDTVVWNPGASLAASIADLGAQEHLRFVCVESGTVVTPVVLAPGEEWSGMQQLRTR